MKRAIYTALLISVCSLPAIAGVAGPAQIQAIETQTPVETGPLIVPFGQSVMLKTSNPISGISVGSPVIADVAVHDANSIFVTGRSFGITSLHILDNKGRVIMERPIQVVDANPGKMTIVRGSDQFTMDCSPKCQPMPSPGDNKDYFETVLSQSETLSGQ